MEDVLQQQEVHVYVQNDENPDVLTQISEEYVRLQTKFTEMEAMYKAEIETLTKNMDGQKIFSCKMLQLASDLFGQEHLSDMKVHLEGDQQIYGHKFIFLARSDVWGDDNNNLLTADTLDLSGVRFEVAIDLVRWVYRDEIEESASIEHLTDLLHVASSYKLQTLFQRCIDLINGHPNSEPKINTDLTIDSDMKVERKGDKLIIRTNLDHSYDDKITEINTDNMIVIKEEPDEDFEQMNAEEETDENKIAEDKIDNQIVEKNDDAEKLPQEELNDKSVLNMTMETAVALMENQVHECEHCHKQYKSQFKLRDHKKVHFRHLNGKLFKCPDCGKGFPRKVNLDLHMAIHTGVKAFPCLFCDSSFYQKGSFKKHVKLHHKDEEVLQCSSKHCGEIFATEDSLAEHEETHINPTEYYHCNSCARVFTSMKNLSVHQRVHLKQSCKVCKKTFTSSVLLRDHMVVHGPDYDKTCVCLACGETFKTRAGLMTHVRSHKLNKEKYTCKVCGESFTNNRSFEVHAKLHEGAELYRCTFCERGFNSKILLRDHMKGHMGDKPFKCAYCAQAFTRRGSLRRHTNLHTKETYYPCTFSGCSKKFLDKTCLVKHLKIHSGLKPFKCEHCSKGFYVSEDLRRHQVIHFDERPFKCPDCDMSFKASNRLRRHSLVHSDKPNKCQHCGKGFIRPHQLQNHLLKCLEKTKVIQEGLGLVGSSLSEELEPTLCIDTTMS